MTVRNLWLVSFTFRAVDPEVIDGRKEDYNQQHCRWPV